MTASTDGDVVSFRALIDEEALVWLASDAPVTASNADVARLFGRCCAG